MVQDLSQIWVRRLRTAVRGVRGMRSTGSIPWKEEVIDLCLSLEGLIIIHLLSNRIYSSSKDIGQVREDLRGTRELVRSS